MVISPEAGVCVCVCVWMTDSCCVHEAVHHLVDTAENSFSRLPSSQGSAEATARRDVFITLCFNSLPEVTPHRRLQHGLEISVFH